VVDTIERAGRDQPHAMTNGRAAGVAQVDIVKATGYTRDQVRQILLPAEQRRSRRSGG